MRNYITTSHRLFSPFITSIIISMLVFLTCQPGFAQVAYDGNGTLIGAASATSLIQGGFTVPAGDDRMLVVFVTVDSDGTTTDSVTYNGQMLTNLIEHTGGGVGLKSGIWYLLLGCGDEISSSVMAHFGGGVGMADIIVGAASYQDVNQINTFGTTATQNGEGSSSGPVNVSTTDSNGLVLAVMSTDVFSGGAVSVSSTGTGQTEVYEGSVSNNSGQGSFSESDGGTVNLMWNFSSSCSWQVAAAEVFAADADGDGVPDCDDLCPDDPLKSEPGDCGCGNPETCDPNNDIVRVMDADSNLQWSINDEGQAGSVTIRSLPEAPVITTDKLYAVDGILYYNGGAISPDSASSLTIEQSGEVLGSSPVFPSALSRTGPVPVQDSRGPADKTVLNGNVVLDNNGEAIVELQTSTESPHRDFRYQLTCIGKFAPIFIAEEIQHSTFKIAGGEPGMKISWQVTISH